MGLYQELTPCSFLSIASEIRSNGTTTIPLYILAPPNRAPYSIAHTRRYRIGLTNGPVWYR